MAAKKLKPVWRPYHMDAIRGLLATVVWQKIAGFQKYSAREIRALPRGNPVGLTTAAAAA